MEFGPTYGIHSFKLTFLAMWVKSASTRLQVFLRSHSADKTKTNVGTTKTLMMGLQRHDVRA
jgi:predicted ATPase